MSVINEKLSNVLERHDYERDLVFAIKGFTDNLG